MDGGVLDLSTSCNKKYLSTTRWLERGILGSPRLTTNGRLLCSAMRADDHKATTQHRWSLRAIVVRALWFCLLFLCVGALLVWAAVVSFPRAGASEPLSGGAACQERCGIVIMRVTHYPFYGLEHFFGAGGTEVLIWIFGAAVCYTPFALFRWPRWVFRLPPTPET